MIAEMRLQWWRDALEEIAAGQTVRRHEVVDAAGAMCWMPRGAGCWTGWSRRAVGISTATRSRTCAHFRAYIEATSASLMLAIARALGGAPEVPETPLRHAGRALGIANWLRAVPALERAGRIPLVDGTPEGVRALAEEGLEAASCSARGTRRGACCAASGAAAALAGGAGAEARGKRSRAGWPKAGWNWRRRNVALV